MNAIEPTPEEAKNGWTPEALAAYRAESDQAAAIKIQRVFGEPGKMNARGVFIPSRPVFVENVKAYNPHRW